MIDQDNYTEARRIYYDRKGEENAVFIPVCEKCGRFVKANTSVNVNLNSGLKDEPNATCSRCGPTQMLFDGFF